MPDEPIFLGHLHDEASLRVRSYIPDPNAPRALARGRASKVQLSLVHVAGMAWKDCFFFWW